MLTPTSSVTSVFGRIGAITAQPNDYTSDQINETASRVFVTSEQKIVLSNTSGTNTGDNAVNTLYSGLESSKQNTLTNPITGTLTQNYIPKAGVGNTLVNSLMIDNLSYTSNNGIFQIISSDEPVTRLRLTNINPSGGDWAFVAGLNLIDNTSFSIRDLQRGFDRIVINVKSDFL